VCWCVWVGNWCVGVCGLVTGVLVRVGFVTQCDESQLRKSVFKNHNTVMQLTKFHVRTTTGYSRRRLCRALFFLRPSCDPQKVDVKQSNPVRNSGLARG